MVAFGSHSKNGALSASSASELDFSGEEEEDEVPASVQARPNAHRTHARRAEVNLYITLKQEQN